MKKNTRKNQWRPSLFESGFLLRPTTKLRTSNEIITSRPYVHCRRSSFLCFETPPQKQNQGLNPLPAALRIMTKKPVHTRPSPPRAKRTALGERVWRGSLLRETAALPGQTSCMCELVATACFFLFHYSWCGILGVFKRITCTLSS